jgi:uncharacterized protein YeeX (DUF496 family)
MPSYLLPELCKNFSSETCSLACNFSAINGVFRKVAFTPNTKCMTVEMLMDECKPGIDATFEEILKKRIKCKVNFGIQVLFQKINFNDGTVEEEDVDYMSVDAMTIQSGAFISGLIDNACDQLQEKIDDYTNRGSNWIVAAIQQLIISLVAFK